MESYQGTEYQPEFYVSNSYFMITLHSWNQFESHDTQNDTQNDPQKLDIITLIKIEIKNNPSITRGHISDNRINTLLIMRKFFRSIKFLGKCLLLYWTIRYNEVVKGR